MAQGSQPFAWKLYEGVPRTCWECSRLLKVKDVAEVRTTHPPKYRFATRFRCTTCFQELVNEAVQRAQFAIRP